MNSKMQPEIPLSVFNGKPEIIFVDSTPHGLPLFGKLFPLLEQSETPRVLVHTDYPMIGGGVIKAFIEEASQGDSYAVSAAIPEAHPYLLYRIDGYYDQPLVEASRAERGERRNFCEVYVARPALLWIPAGLGIPSESDRFTLFKLDAKFLLDQGCGLEALSVNFYKNCSR